MVYWEGCMEDGVQREGLALMMKIQLSSVFFQKQVVLNGFLFSLEFIDFYGVQGGGWNWGN